MSRRVVENTKGATDDVDTTPEIQGGWGKSNVGELGIHARGICWVHRKTFVIFYTISGRFFSPRIQKITTKITDVRSWVIVHY